MMDRRHFLTGTALGLAGLTGAAALSACTASAPAPAADNADKTAIPATGPSDEARAASIVEREADVAAKATDTRECDIVILGSGAGGLRAAR